MFDDIVKSEKKPRESRSWGRINSFPKIQENQIISCESCNQMGIIIKNVFPMSRDLSVITFKCISCGHEFKMRKEN